MLQIKKLAILAFMTMGSSAASAANDCAPTTSQNQQCSFDIGVVKSGEAKVFSNTSNSNFTGAIAVACKDGYLEIGKSTCETVDKSTCAVPAAQWYGDDNTLCSHEAQSVPIVTDGSMKVKSSNGSGSVSYSCSEGALITEEIECGISSQKSSYSIPSSGSLGTQSIETKDYSFSLYFTSSDSSVSPGLVQAAALKKCMEIDGFSATTPVAYEKKWASGASYVYVATCNMSVALECDEGLAFNASVLGGYSSSTGEFSNPPSYSSHKNVCTREGYTDLVENLYNDETVPNVIDDFTLIQKCSGKTSSCESTEDKALGSPFIVSASTCFEAEVRSGLIKVNRGAVVTQGMMVSEICEPLGFETLSRAISSTLEDQTNGNDFYSVKAVCSGYTKTKTEPLLSSCSASADGAVSSEPMTCDTGRVTRQISGEYSPSTGELSASPSDGTISAKLCSEAKYTVLDRVVSNSKAGAADDLYNVIAECSGYVGEDRPNCESLGPCYGDEVSSTSEEQKILIDGKYYINLCASESDPSSEICESCEEGVFSYKDTATGNTCAVTTGANLSGESRNVKFSNEHYYGEVDVSCNNGQKFLDLGGAATCFKTCKGNTLVGWSDKNGANSCSQLVPSGIYKDGERVHLSSSRNHTGTSYATCDGTTGAWEVSGGQCKLDCAGNLSWGSGVSKSGVNKNGACSVSIPTLSHGQTGSYDKQITASTPVSDLTSGEVDYRCDDGVIKTSNASCNLGCAMSQSTNVSWGSQCVSKGVVKMAHDEESTIYHDKSLNRSYAFWDTITGSSEFSCLDGKVSGPGSSQCNYVTGRTNPSWGGWVDNGADTCSAWSPARNTQIGNFTASTTCYSPEKRTRAIYNTWASSGNTYYKTETETRTRSYTRTETQSGTKQPTGTTAGNWTGWSSNGGASCGAWSPSANTQTGNFTASKVCYQPEKRTRTIYNTWSGSPNTYLKTETDTRNRRYTLSEVQSGTKAPVGPVCKGDNGNYIEGYTYSYSDYGREGTREDGYSLDYFYNGVNVYHYEERYSDRDGDRFEETGSTNGYSKGAQIVHSASGNGQRTRYEICK